MRFLVTLLVIGSLSTAVNAQVYKCTDPEVRKVQYRDDNCPNGHKTEVIDVATGAVREKQNSPAPELIRLQQEQLALQKAAEEQAEKLRFLQAIKSESDTNLALLKSRSHQFSAMAIRPYQYDQLDSWQQPYQQRLPDIERMRRLAALKVLEQGQCQRVEASELSRSSRQDNLVFTVSCSNQPEILLTEQEL